MKRICLLMVGIMGAIMTIGSSWVNATTADGVRRLIDRMTTEEKIAQMIMPSFRWSCVSQKDCGMTEMTSEVEALLRRRNFGGVILFGQNIANTEQTVRLIDAMQRANADNGGSGGQLLMAVDQEGGYVTRLAYGTNMPGNMALGATRDKNLTRSAAEVIGGELGAVGFNVDFAPVSDVNNNPKNPVIGVRSFGDEPNMVGEYAEEFMNGLHNKSIITSLKHFPGHGDTATDTHTAMTVVDKTLDELKNMELVPFSKMVKGGIEMIMTAHIQYPQVETETYMARKKNEDGSEIVLTLPATLSEKIITGLLRNEMGFEGVVVTDALDMGAIAEYFEELDVAKLAINAGVDMLLMPVDTSGAEGVRALDQYVGEVAKMVSKGEIPLSKVDAAVERILKLKNERGLLEVYNVDVETKVSEALDTVSTKKNHEQELEIAKKAVTLIKNNDETLPIKANDKVLVAYEYGSHLNAMKYALDKLKIDGKISGNGDVKFYHLADEIEQIKESLGGVKKLIIVNAMYTANGFSGFDGGWDATIDELIKTAHENGVKVVFLSTQLPYDAARFNEADTIVATYLASGLGFDGLIGMEKNIPKYGANVIAGACQMFDVAAEMSGKLPVNIYAVNADGQITDEVLYVRGRGLSYIGGVGNLIVEDNAVSLVILMVGVASIVAVVGLVVFMKKH